jgi:hypothetical protein
LLKYYITATKIIFESSNKASVSNSNVLLRISLSASDGSHLYPQQHALCYHLPQKWHLVGIFNLDVDL